MSFVPAEMRRPATVPGWATPTIQRNLCYWQARDSQCDRMWHLYAPDGTVVGAFFSVLEVASTEGWGHTRYSYSLTDPDTQPPTTLYATKEQACAALVERKARAAA